MKNILIVIGIIVGIVLFFKWSAWHDQQIEIGAQTYEKCMRATYGMSPANYYAEKGEYPVCQ